MNLTDAPKELSELVDEATRAGEVVINREGEAVAKIIPLRRTRAPRRRGSARVMIHMAEDFDATPVEFCSYT